MHNLVFDIYPGVYYINTHDEVLTHNATPVPAPVPGVNPPPPPTQLGVKILYVYLKCGYIGIINLVVEKSMTLVVKHFVCK